jgi:hypothetical protein
MFGHGGQDYFLAKDGEADYVDGGEDTDDREFDPGLDTFVSIP